MERIKLYMTPGGHMERVHASRYDIGRPIEISLLESPTDRTAYMNNSADINVYVNGLKPDNHIFSYSSDENPTIVDQHISSGYIIFYITEQAAALSGDVTCEVVLETDDLKIGSANFILEVESGVFDDNADLSETEIPALIALARQQEANAAASAVLAESYAKGGTNSRTGEDTDNASYYKSQAATSATNAGTSETNAAASALQARSYTEGDTNSRTGEATDNAKYYKEQAAASASNASTSETNAGTSESNAASSESAASTSASNAEAYAVGTRGGSNVGSTDPAYENNAKHYAEQAAASAAAAAVSASVDFGLTVVDGKLCVQYDSL